MTIEQFDTTGWTGNMKCTFQDKEYYIATVDFEEKLVGIYEKIQGGDEDDVSWKRCENIELV
jgi:major membrane immunogen (membrane-anchored lipoprotein)